MSTSSSPERVPPPPVTTRRHIEHDVLVGALPHPILVLAGDERVIYANVAAETFFQSSQAVLKRQQLGAIVSDDCPLIALARQVARTGSTVNEYGVLISTPKVQAPRLVDIYGGPLPDAPDLVLLMLQQRSMAQMIERQLTHRAAARSVSGLAAVLAHEINNPLSGIRGAAQLLEPSLTDEDRALARLNCAETDRIKNLVDRMEVFGDERPLATEPVNIQSVLDHVKRIAETGFARGIRINEQYDPSLPPIPGNRDKLVQAFLNLVKNAAEALSESRGGGRITLNTAFRPGVRLSVPGSQARVALPLMIEVEDNGPGIAEAVRSHLFDPFVTTKRTGTGLGLALVAKIVGDHGGIIECDSEPRKTVFRVLLPMQDRAGNLTKRGP
jgi:two-component system nitrogen regulation sensor histidine kinase GlnL